MSRCKDAPSGFQCPFRDKCPHLDNHSTTWVMEVYQEAFDLRRRLNLLELDSQKRIDELGKALLERDAKIAQLRLEHQKQFKANVKKPPIKVTARPARRRGGPRRNASRCGNRHRPPPGNSCIVLDKGVRWSAGSGPA